MTKHLYHVRLGFTFGSPVKAETNSFMNLVFPVVRHDFRIDRGKKKNGISVLARWGKIAREGTSFHWQTQ
jgi:hypothetical protein